jgi:DNA-binding transcriptional ArsR family regulator
MSFFGFFQTALPEWGPLAAALDALLYFLPYILLIAIPIVVYKIFSRKRSYEGRMVEIKEAAVELNNLLKDSVKRNILRALRKQKKYMTAISREIGEDAPRMRYHLKQLEKAGLVRSFKLAREAYFSLTDKGRWSLSAINYYYPTSNAQLIWSRMRKVAGLLKMKKFVSRKGRKFQDDAVQ